VCLFIAQSLFQKIEEKLKPLQNKFAMLWPKPSREMKTKENRIAQHTLYGDTWKPSRGLSLESFLLGRQRGVIEIEVLFWKERKENEHI
jgi:hypothetical protein